MSFEALDQSEAAEGLNINYLLDPNPYQHADTISHIVTDIVKTYTEIDTLPKQVSILYIINKLLTVRFYSFQRDILHLTRCRISGSSCTARTCTTTCRHGQGQRQSRSKYHIQLGSAASCGESKTMPTCSSHLICDLRNQRPDVREYPHSTSRD